ncbi:hypothetical protein NHG24_04235 [Aerococcaceae bacterium NML210727]|nr:hypothetical protein [Aerococcaceae bacterium NML210727]MCW6654506.1 hypothetical protein [Aerococcaceae bacterium NML201296]
MKKIIVLLSICCLLFVPTIRAEEKLLGGVIDLNDAAATHKNIMKEFGVKQVSMTESVLPDGKVMQEWLFEKEDKAAGLVGLGATKDNKFVIFGLVQPDYEPIVDFFEERFELKKMNELVEFIKEPVTDKTPDHSAKGIQEGDLYIVVERVVKLRELNIATYTISITVNQSLYELLITREKV